MFHYRGFKEAQGDKPLREWQDGPHKGVLVFSRDSALEPDGQVLGLHLIVSYNEVMTAPLSPIAKAALMMRATLEFYNWLEVSGVPGQVAMAQQDMPWGTQPHLHIHFYVTEVEKLKEFGFKPRRLVTPMSRLEPIVS